MAYADVSSPGYCLVPPTITMQFVVLDCIGKDREDMTVRAAPDVKLYTVRQVAAIMNISESKVWQLTRSGELESVKIGWSRRVVAASVNAYIKRLAAGGAR
jgi:excisionase family DNA binding protein